MSLLFTGRVRNHDHKLYFSFQFENTTSYVSLICIEKSAVCHDISSKVRKNAKIRNQYNQAPYLPRTPHGKVTKHNKT